ncbi:hypothetical protein ZWY2020_006075 [Hordeum vulgare]|nr:hypothetical protein ZWY2020_006075 [Hordeum vulgare]
MGEPLSASTPPAGVPATSAPHLGGRPLPGGPSPASLGGRLPSAPSPGAPPHRGPSRRTSGRLLLSGTPVSTGTTPSPPSPSFELRLHRAVSSPSMRPARQHVRLTRATETTGFPAILVDLLTRLGYRWYPEYTVFEDFREYNPMQTS